MMYLVQVEEQGRGCGDSKVLTTLLINSLSVGDKVLLFPYLRHIYKNNSDESSCLEDTMLLKVVEHTFIKPHCTRLFSSNISDFNIVITQIMPLGEPTVKK